jgi:hypothetical protein
VSEGRRRRVEPGKIRVICQHPCNQQQRLCRQAGGGWVGGGRGEREKWISKRILVVWDQGRRQCLQFRYLLRLSSWHFARAAWSCPLGSVDNEEVIERCSGDLSRGGTTRANGLCAQGRAMV